MSPVITVVLTAPATVIPAPARTAKLESVPRFTVGVAVASWCKKMAAATAKPILAEQEIFIIFSFLYLVVFLTIMMFSLAPERRLWTSGRHFRVRDPVIFQGMVIIACGNRTG